MAKASGIYCVNKMKKTGIILWIAVIIAIGIPVCILVVNTLDYQWQKLDDQTNYETLKKVEDTARSYISSYESDKLMYEQYKSAESLEQRSWADAAKTRANRTAITYNEYLLKNSFVWKDGIPNDIRQSLEVVQ